MVLKANVRALLNELTLLLGRKKSSGFFFLLFVRGVLRNIFSLCDFASQSGQVGNFALILSQSLSWLQGGNAIIGVTVLV